MKQESTIVVWEQHENGDWSMHTSNSIIRWPPQMVLWRTHDGCVSVGGSLIENGHNQPKDIAH